MKTICNTQKRHTTHSTYIALVEQIFNETNRPQRYNGSLESMLREFFSKTSQKKYTWKRRTFKTLLIHLYNQKCYALLRSYTHVEVLHNISSFGNKLVRDPEDWENKYLSKDAQIEALIKYCFAKYEMPKFMESAFYGSHKLHMLWYVQLGKGVGVKNLSQLPVTLTHRMAHEFKHAPSCFSINEALRYAQALGFGAAKPAAIIIAFSKLSRTRDTEEQFWSTVVQFFTRVECLEANELDQIIDYLTHKYREDQNLSMKGRTFNALLNQTNEWHRTLYIERDVGQVLTWKGSGIKPLYVEEDIDGCKIVYKTIELRNSIELYDEGMAMQHCVAEYDEDCHNGDSAIFSLQKEVVGEPMKRLATLEITLSDYRIVQAKAKYNHDPDAEVMALIDKWINSSTVRKHTNTVNQRPAYQPAAYARYVERERMTNYDLEASAIIRLIVVILYLFFLFGRLMTPQESHTPSFNYIPNEYQKDSFRELDSVLKAAYQNKWSQDSISKRLKEIKWQN